MNGITVQCERGRDDVVGPTLGPFQWVQITYGELRASKTDDDNGEIVLATMEGGMDGDWILSDPPEGAEATFSDLIIGTADADGTAQLRAGIEQALDVLHQLANEAGDVAFWNDGGDGRECAKHLRSLLR